MNHNSGEINDVFLASSHLMYVVHVSFYKNFLVLSTANISLLKHPPLLITSCTMDLRLWLNVVAMSTLILMVDLLLLLSIGTSAFLQSSSEPKIWTKNHNSPRRIETMLFRTYFYGLNSWKSNDDEIGVPFGDTLDIPETDSGSDKNFLSALKQREEELRQGIGRRYITRTQKGFLNVHEKVSR
jgi:hypothetical protein